MTAYTTILADPPWRFRDLGTRMAPSYAGEQRAGAHYRTMSEAEICALPVVELAAPDAFLFLWAPHALVLDGTAMRVAQAWGFTPKQEIPWVKLAGNGRPRMGGGHYARVCSEPMLLCVRGRPKRLSAGVPGVILAPRSRHSAKPPEQYELIERLAPGPKVELFARSTRAGWDCWGNEVMSDAEVGAVWLGRMQWRWAQPVPRMRAPRCEKSMTAIERLREIVAQNASPSTRFALSSGDCAELLHEIDRLRGRAETAEDAAAGRWAAEQNRLTSEIDQRCSETREACARVCDERAKSAGDGFDPFDDIPPGAWERLRASADEAEACAAAIRAMGAP
jgi:N6-adenosine-specific RNA methylase IME4